MDIDRTTAEELARVIAPYVCRPVHNGDCDDIAAGHAHAVYVAQAILTSDVIARIERDAEERGAADTRAKVIEECARALQGTNADLCRDAGLAYRTCYAAVRKLGENP